MANAGECAEAALIIVTCAICSNVKNQNIALRVALMRISLEFMLCMYWSWFTFRWFYTDALNDEKSRTIMVMTMMMMMIENDNDCEILQKGTYSVHRFFTHFSFLLLSFDNNICKSISDRWILTKLCLFFSLRNTYKSTGDIFFKPKQFTWKVMYDVHFLKCDQRPNIFNANDFPCFPYLFQQTEQFFPNISYANRQTSHQIYTVAFFQYFP